MQSIFSARSHTYTAAHNPALLDGGGGCPFDVVVVGAPCRPTAQAPGTVSAFSSVCTCARARVCVCECECECVRAWRPRRRAQGGHISLSAHTYVDQSRRALPLSLTHLLTLPFSLSHTHTHTFSLSLPLTHIHTGSRTLPRTHSPADLLARAAVSDSLSIYRAGGVLKPHQGASAV